MIHRGRINLALLASCIACGTQAAPATPAQSVSRSDDPKVVLQQLADEGYDASRLAKAVLGLANPEIAFVGEIPITLTRADGSRPSYPVHPQGLAWIPATKQWALSAVEITRERDKSERPEGDPNGDGHPYVFFADAIGRSLPALVIEPPVTAASFHPGGIDWADGNIYVSLSPYARNSRADLLSVPPASKTPITLGTIEDHIGVVTISSGHGRPALMHAASWDARRWYTLGLDSRVMWKADSPSALAFQDGQGLAGTDYVLWSGVVNPGETAFGFALIRVNGEQMEPARTIQWPSDRYLTPQGRAPLHNAAFFWADRENRIWILAVPDDQHGRWRPHPHSATDAAAGGEVEDPEAGRGTSLRIYRVLSATATSRK